MAERIEIELGLKTDGIINDFEEVKQVAEKTSKDIQTEFEGKNYLEEMFGINSGVTTKLNTLISNLHELTIARKNIDSADNSWSRQDSTEKYAYNVDTTQKSANDLMMANKISSQLINGVEESFRTAIISGVQSAAPMLSKELHDFTKTAVQSLGYDLDGKKVLLDDKSIINSFYKSENSQRVFGKLMKDNPTVFTEDNVKKIIQASIPLYVPQYMRSGFQTNQTHNAPSNFREMLPEEWRSLPARPKTSDFIKAGGKGTVGGRSEHQVLEFNNNSNSEESKQVDVLFDLIRKNRFAADAAQSAGIIQKKNGKMYYNPNTTHAMINAMGGFLMHDVELGARGERKYGILDVDDEDSFHNIEKKTNAYMTQGVDAMRVMHDTFGGGKTKWFRPGYYNDVAPFTGTGENGDRADGVYIGNVQHSPRMKSRAFAEYTLSMMDQGLQINGENAYGYDNTPGVGWHVLTKMNRKTKEPDGPIIKPNQVVYDRDNVRNVDDGNDETKGIIVSSPDDWHTISLRGSLEQDLLEQHGEKHEHNQFSKNALYLKIADQLADPNLPNTKEERIALGNDAYPLSREEYINEYAKWIKQGYTVDGKHYSFTRFNRTHAEFVPDEIIESIGGFNPKDYKNVAPDTVEQLRAEARKRGMEFFANGAPISGEYTDFKSFAKALDVRNKNATDAENIKDYLGTDLSNAKVVVGDFRDLDKNGNVREWMNGVNMISDRLTPQSFQGRAYDAKATYSKINVKALRDLYSDYIEGDKETGDLVLPGVGLYGSDLRIPYDVDIIEDVANIKNFKKEYGYTYDPSKKGNGSLTKSDIEEAQKRVNESRSAAYKDHGLYAKTTYEDAATNSRWISHQLVQAMNGGFDDPRVQEYFDNIFFQELDKLEDDQQVRKLLFNNDQYIDLNSDFAQTRIRNYRNMLFERRGQNDVLLPAGKEQYRMAAPMFTNVVNRALKNAGKSLTDDQKLMDLKDEDVALFDSVSEWLGLARYPATYGGNIEAKNVAGIPAAELAKDKKYEPKIKKMAKQLGLDMNGLYFSPNSFIMDLMQTEDFDGDINAVFETGKLLGLTRDELENSIKDKKKGSELTHEEVMALVLKRSNETKSEIDRLAGQSATRRAEQKDKRSISEVLPTHKPIHSENGTENVFSMEDEYDIARALVESKRDAAKMGVPSTITKNAWQYGKSPIVARALQDAEDHYDVVSTYAKEGKSYEMTNDEKAILYNGGVFSQLFNWASKDVETVGDNEDSEKQWTPYSQKKFNARNIDKINLPSINIGAQIAELGARFIAKQRGHAINGERSDGSQIFDWDQIFTNLPAVNTDTYAGKLTSRLRDIKKGFANADYLMLSDAAYDELREMARLANAEIIESVNNDPTIKKEEKASEIRKRASSAGIDVVNNIGLFGPTTSNVERNPEAKTAIGQIASFYPNANYYYEASDEWINANPTSMTHEERQKRIEEQNQEAAKLEQERNNRLAKNKNRKLREIARRRQRNAVANQQEQQDFIDITEDDVNRYYDYQLGDTPTMERFKSKDEYFQRQRNRRNAVAAAIEKRTGISPERLHELTILDENDSSITDAEKAFKSTEAFADYIKYNDAPNMNSWFGERRERALSMLQAKENGVKPTLDELANVGKRTLVDGTIVYDDEDYHKKVLDRIKAAKQAKRQSVVISPITEEELIYEDMILSDSKGERIASKELLSTVYDETKDKYKDWFSKRNSSRNDHSVASATNIMPYMLGPEGTPDSIFDIKRDRYFYDQKTGNFVLAPDKISSVKLYDESMQNSKYLLDILGSESTGQDAVMGDIMHNAWQKFWQAGATGNIEDYYFKELEGSTKALSDVGLTYNKDNHFVSGWKDEEINNITSTAQKKQEKYAKRIGYEGDSEKTWTKTSDGILHGLQSFLTGLGEEVVNIEGINKEGHDYLKSKAPGWNEASDINVRPDFITKRTVGGKDEYTINDYKSSRFSAEHGIIQAAIYAKQIEDEAEKALRDGDKSNEWAKFGRLENGEFKSNITKIRTVGAHGEIYETNLDDLINYKMANGKEGQISLRDAIAQSWENAIVAKRDKYTGEIDDETMYGLASEELKQRFGIKLDGKQYATMMKNGISMYDDADTLAMRTLIHDLNIRSSADKNDVEKDLAAIKSRQVFDENAGEALSYYSQLKSNIRKKDNQLENGSYGEQYFNQTVGMAQMYMDKLDDFRKSEAYGSLETNEKELIDKMLLGDKSLANLAFQDYSKRGVLFSRKYLDNEYDNAMKAYNPLYSQEKGFEEAQNKVKGIQDFSKNIQRIIDDSSTSDSVRASLQSDLEVVNRDKDEAEFMLAKRKERLDAKEDRFLLPDVNANDPFRERKERLMELENTLSDRQEYFSHMTIDDPRHNEYAKKNGRLLMIAQKERANLRDDQNELAQNIEKNISNMRLNTSGDVFDSITASANKATESLEKLINQLTEVYKSQGEAEESAKQHAQRIANGIQKNIDDEKALKTKRTKENLDRKSIVTKAELESRGLTYDEKKKNILRSKKNELEDEQRADPEGFKKRYNGRSINDIMKDYLFAVSGDLATEKIISDSLMKELNSEVTGETFSIQDKKQLAMAKERQRLESAYKNNPDAFAKTFGLDLKAFKNNPQDLQIAKDRIIDNLVKQYGTVFDDKIGLQNESNAALLARTDIQDKQLLDRQAMSRSQRFIQKAGSYSFTNMGHMATRRSASMLQKISERESYNSKVEEERINQRLLDAQIKAAKDEEQKNALIAQKQASENRMATYQKASVNAITKGDIAGQMFSPLLNGLDTVTQAITRMTSRLGRQLFQRVINEVKQFVKQYDQALTTIQMITLKTDEQMQSVSDNIVNTATDLKVSIADVSSVYSSLYRQGLNDEQVQERGEDVVKFAKVTGMKPEDAVKIMTTAINTELVDNANEAMDALVALGDSAATTASEISKGMQKSAAAAKNAGVSYAQLVSMLTVITSKTQLSGTVAGTTLQSVFGRMQKISSGDIVTDEEGHTIGANDVYDALSRVGINMYDENGEMRGAYDILYDVAQNWEGMSSTNRGLISYAFAGTRQKSNFEALIGGLAEEGDNGKLIDEYIGKATDSEGITDKKYDKYMESLAAAITEVKNAFDSLINSVSSSDIATNVLAWVTNIVDGLSEITNGINALSGSSIPATIIGIVSLVTAIKTITTAAKTSVAAIELLGNAGKAVAASNIISAILSLAAIVTSNVLISNTERNGFKSKISKDESIDFEKSVNMSDFNVKKYNDEKNSTIQKLDSLESLLKNQNRTTEDNESLIDLAEQLAKLGIINEQVVENIKNVVSGNIDALNNNTEAILSYTDDKRDEIESESIADLLRFSGSRSFDYQSQDTTKSLGVSDSGNIVSYDYIPLSGSQINAGLKNYSNGFDEIYGTGFFGSDDAEKQSIWIEEWYKKINTWKSMNSEEDADLLFGDKDYMALRTMMLYAIANFGDITNTAFKDLLNPNGTINFNSKAFDIPSDNLTSTIAPDVNEFTANPRTNIFGLIVRNRGGLDDYTYSYNNEWDPYLLGGYLNENNENPNSSTLVRNLLEFGASNGFFNSNNPYSFQNRYFEKHHLDLKDVPGLSVLTPDAIISFLSTYDDASLNEKRAAGFIMHTVLPDLQKYALENANVSDSYSYDDKESSNKFLLAESYIDTLKKQANNTTNIDATTLNMALDAMLADESLNGLNGNPDLSLYDKKFKFFFDYDETTKRYSPNYTNMLDYINGHYGKSYQMGYAVYDDNGIKISDNLTNEEADKLIAKNSNSWKMESGLYVPPETYSESWGYNVANQVLYNTPNTNSYSSLFGLGDLLRIPQDELLENNDAYKIFEKILDTDENGNQIETYLLSKKLDSSKKWISQGQETRDKIIAATGMSSEYWENLWDKYGEEDSEYIIELMDQAAKNKQTEFEIGTRMRNISGLSTLLGDNKFRSLTEAYANYASDAAYGENTDFSRQRLVALTEYMIGTTLGKKNALPSNLAQSYIDNYSSIDLETMPEEERKMLGNIFGIDTIIAAQNGNQYAVKKMRDTVNQMAFNEKYEWNPYLQDASSIISQVQTGKASDISKMLASTNAQTQTYSNYNWAYENLDTTKSWEQLGDVTKQYISTVTGLNDSQLKQMWANDAKKARKDISKLAENNFKDFVGGFALAANAAIESATDVNLSGLNASEASEALANAGLGWINSLIEMGILVFDEATSSISGTSGTTAVKGKPEAPTVAETISENNKDVFSKKQAIDKIQYALTGRITESGRQNAISGLLKSNDEDLVNLLNQNPDLANTLTLYTNGKATIEQVNAQLGAVAKPITSSISYRLATGEGLTNYEEQYVNMVNENASRGINGLNERGRRSFANQMVSDLLVNGTYDAEDQSMISDISGAYTGLDRFYSMAGWINQYNPDLTPNQIYNWMKQEDKGTISEEDSMALYGIDKMFEEENSSLEEFYNILRNIITEMQTAPELFEGLGEAAESTASDIAGLNKSFKSYYETLGALRTKESQVAQNQWYINNIRKGQIKDEEYSYIDSAAGQQQGWAKRNWNKLSTDEQERWLTDFERQNNISAQEVASTRVQQIGNIIAGNESFQQKIQAGALVGFEIDAYTGAINIDTSKIDVENINQELGADLGQQVADVMQGTSVEATGTVNITAGTEGSTATATAEVSNVKISKINTGSAGRKSGGGGGKSKAQKTIDSQKHDQSLREHVIKMHQYEETMYENRGELTNYGIILEKETAIRKQNASAIEENIKTLKAELATTKKNTDDWYSLRDAILAAEEEYKENSQAIEDNNKKLKENQQAILKTHTDLEDVVKQEIEERKQQQRDEEDGYATMQENILNTIKARMQEEWDLIKEDTERKKEALQEEEAMIDERLQRRKNATDEAKKYEELAELQRQYTLISADSTRTKEASQLRKKIADLQEEIAWDEAENEAEIQKKRLEDQSEAYDDFIEEGDYYLEELFKDSNNFADQVNEVMQMNKEEMIQWLEDMDLEYQRSLDGTQTTMVRGWEDTFNQMKGIIETWWDEIERILTDKATFLKYMMEEANKDFHALSDDAKAQMQYQWEEAYDAKTSADLHSEEADKFKHSDGEEDVNNGDKPKSWKAYYHLKSSSGASLDGFGVSSESEADARLQARGVARKKTGADMSTFGVYKVVPQYLHGGLVNYTGPAWVDGTPTKPEAFLNADDTVMIRDLLDAFKFTFSPAMTNVNTAGYASHNNTIGDVYVTLNEAQFNDDSDYDTIAQKVGQAFVKQLSINGFGSTSYNF